MIIHPLLSIFSILSFIIFIIYFSGKFLCVHYKYSLIFLLHMKQIEQILICNAAEKEQIEMYENIYAIRVSYDFMCHSFVVKILSLLFRPN